MKSNTMNCSTYEDAAENVNDIDDESFVYVG